MLCGDERDGFPEVAHAFVREHWLVGELEPVAFRAGNVVVRQDGMHAGHAERPGDVDRDDARVRVRAAQRVAPEHARGLEVARVCELAGDLRECRRRAATLSPTRPS